MCGICGWVGNASFDAVHRLLEATRRRGRDGYGSWADGIVHRKESLDENDLQIETDRLQKASKVLVNFRATPTSERETRRAILQPYDGLVHNGMVANDEELAYELGLGPPEIDSMVLPHLLRGDDGQPLEVRNSIRQAMDRVEGSYALAYPVESGIIVVVNYKPLYYEVKAGRFMFSSVEGALEDPRPVEPYSIGLGRRNSFNSGPLSEETPPESVVVSASAGLDSTTMAYMLQDQGYDVTLAHFLYGCKAEDREVSRIEEIANHGGFDLEFIELPRVASGTIVEGTYYGGTEERAERGVEYAEDWVSARNLLMLSTLTAYAESNDIGYVAFGGNLEESGAYPDNEEAFGDRFADILPYAVNEGVQIGFKQPLTRMMKHEIVARGLELDVPYELTWSCYGDGEEHCGQCGPCYMRKKAFRRNGRKDPVML